MASRRRVIRRQLQRKGISTKHIGFDDKALHELRSLRRQNPKTDIRISGGKGFYQITGHTRKGEAWVQKRVQGAERGQAYTDSGSYAQDIARGAIKDGLTVAVNGQRITLKQANPSLFAKLIKSAKKIGKGYARMIKATHQPKFAAAASNAKRRSPRSTGKRGRSSALPALPENLTDAQIRQMIKDRDPRIDVRAHRNPRKRKTNAGMGREFRFHGAYFKKSDAVKKEAPAPGAFIKFTPAGGGRFLVVTRINRNPQSGTVVRVRKQNVQFGEYENGVFHPWTRRPYSQIRPARKGARRHPGRPNPKGTQRFRCDQCGKTFAHFEQYDTHRRQPHRRRDKILYGLKRELGLVKSLYKKNPRTRKTNGSTADSAELYRQFHGRDATKLTDVLQRIVSRDSYAGLGTLVRLVINGETEINFPDDGRDSVMLASDPKGRQLFLIGGDQDVSALLQGRKGVDRTKDLIDLGELKGFGKARSIEYFTRKKFDNFQPITYVHEFGEVSGVRPRLQYDRLNKQLHIVGGNYQVKPEGIVD